MILNNSFLFLQICHTVGKEENNVSYFSVYSLFFSLTSTHLTFDLFPRGGGGGALRYRGGPHLSYVFRGRRGLFEDLRMSAIL